MSLCPLQVEELDSSPPSHHPEEVEDSDGPVRRERGEVTTCCYHRLICQSRNHKGGGFFNLSALKAAVLVYLINLSVIIVNIANLFF